MKSQKHVLYKPASRGTVGSKGQRKPLAQGRLTSKINGAGESTANAGVAGNVSDDVRNSLSSQRLMQGFNHDHDGVINITASQSPLQETTHTIGGHKHLSSGDLNDNTLSGSVLQHSYGNILQPRDDHPHLSMAQSPKLARPTRVLDISDSDSNLSLDPPNIVVVDARGQIKDANMSEVNISVGYARSPVKVTCHSPDKVHSNLRNTGNVEMGRRVAVDHVPTVSVLADDVFSDDEPVVLHKPPMVVREKTIAGSKIDPHSTAKPALVKTLFHSLLDEPEEVRRASFPQPRPLKDMMEDTESDAREASEADYGPPGYTEGYDEQPKEKAPRKMPKTLNLSDGGLDKKKKKAPRFVSSRYMQAPQKGPMKATDRSLARQSSASEISLKSYKNAATTSLNLNNSAGSNRSFGRRTPTTGKTSSALTRHRPASQKGQRTKSALKTNKRINNSSVSFGTTPEAASSNRLVSTPLSESSNFSSPSGVNVSAIEPMLVHRPAASSSYIQSESPKGKVHIQPGHAHRDHIGAEESYDSSLKPTKKRNGKVGQWDLELLYSRLMQYVYLESKAKKTFQEQENNAMTYLYGLWEENDKQRRRKAELEQQLAQLQHLNLLDDTLDIQKTGLRPVTSGLSEASKQYPSLAEAIDTTRHQIQTRGVYIPPDEEAYADSLLQAVNESEQLLGELSVMIREETPQIADFSNCLDVMRKSATQELAELAQCQKFMSRAHKKSMHEMALQSRSWNLN